MRRKKLRTNRETIALLTSGDLAPAKGGFIHETEPYSACGLCVPITYQTCQCG
jgi:hypothetical protein